MGFRSGLSGRQERTKGERRMIRAVNEWIIRKRDGRTVPFESKLIFRAICNAFRAELNLASGQPLDADIEREVGAITEDVVQEAASDAATDRGVGVEHIQDLVEMQLMKRATTGLLAGTLCTAPSTRRFVLCVSRKPWRRRRQPWLRGCMCDWRMVCGFCLT